MLRAVLFELEGVLIDSHDLRRHALEQALAADGVRLPPPGLDDRYDGVPTRAALSHALTVAGYRADDTAIELAAVRAERAFIEQLGRGFSLTDGAREFLAALSGRTRLGIVTRATRQEADTVLTAGGLDVVFELVVTADDVPTAKPSPASYMRALAIIARRSAVVPKQALALEDGWMGVISAREAGLRCIAVGSPPILPEAAGSGFVPSLRGQTLASLEREVMDPREQLA